ncbi:HNH endonuclease [Cytophagales bacterium LB-30]|uniref:HNH endonuclease n=1 Tax=Shiella aurantiaca TaxID=3058365 RepID=A0ABT8F8T7_9BACT|nr:HNH endonuclease [Shiella aurantiaca]MDN4166664.1 HNH endonuclease [Shiella aurantiaca]
MKSSVLVLNQDYSPITVCSVHRAFLLVFLEKAELVASAVNQSLRSVNQSFPMPSVIRLNRYINIPYKGVVLTRHNIFRRDNHTCQYCGSTRDLTLDHVVPSSKGGKSSWTNLVTACKRCNTRKGDHTPEEVGMALHKRPIKPSYATFLRDFAGYNKAEWLPYLGKSATIEP